MRGAIVALLALGSTVLLTRNLSATDFGIASLGISLATGAAIVSEVGLGAGLIRRIEPPMPVELRAVGGAQLLAALALIAVVWLIALPFGRIGTVIASMLACLPLLAFRTPGMITLERELEYSQVARIEVGEALAYVVALVPGLLAGGGVWGVVLAVNLRFVSGVALMAAIAPGGSSGPRLSSAACEAWFASACTTRLSHWPRLPRPSASTWVLRRLEGCSPWRSGR